MNPGGFPSAAGEFPGRMARGSAKAIATVWGREMSQAIDAIACSWLLLSSGAQI